MHHIWLADVGGNKKQYWVTWVSGCFHLFRLLFEYVLSSSNKDNCVMCTIEHSYIATHLS